MIVLDTEEGKGEKKKNESNSAAHNVTVQEQEEGHNKPDQNNHCLPCIE